MNHWSLREPAAADWPAILKIANASLAEVSGAPPQDEWLANRRAYLQGGKRHHVVALEGGRVAGYAAAEHVLQAPPGEYRIFVVVPPAARQTLGIYLLGELRRYLLKEGARAIRMLEYEADATFLDFLRGRGLLYRRTFALPDGTKVAELRLDAPFASLA